MVETTSGCVKPLSAGELTVKPVRETLCYAKRRLIELVGKGLAVMPRERPRKSAQELERSRMSEDFRQRLKRAKCAFVYYIPSARSISVRKIHPAHPHSRKVLGPLPLPPDAVFVGRYVFPASKAGFLHDLDEAIAEAKCTN